MVALIASGESGDYYCVMKGNTCHPNWDDVDTAGEKTAIERFIAEVQGSEVSCGSFSAENG
jgi:hypothetical protein